MKLRRVNESIDDLLETIEYTLVSLRDDDFFVSVLASGPESIEVIIRLKYNSKTKSTSLEPVYSYFEEVFEYIKHYEKEITILDITPSTTFSTSLRVYFLDKSIGKTVENSIQNADFNELKESIDFCLFSNDCDLDKFSQIKFFIE